MQTGPQVRLQQLESEYAARLRAERMRPVQGMEERMAMYRQEIEEQARADVQRQVCGDTVSLSAC
eukprot:scaffold258393_cov26-Tisochrysis_lutea.AAC.1